MQGQKGFRSAEKINNTGLVEIPMGTTLRDDRRFHRRRHPQRKKFKSAQTGGPSGGCIPASLIDTPIDYDNLIAIGAMMGSGGLIVMDEDTCMVDIAKFFLEFTVDEILRKVHAPAEWAPGACWEMGTRSPPETGEMEVRDEMEELAAYISASLCALGPVCPKPRISTPPLFP